MARQSHDQAVFYYFVEVVMAVISDRYSELRIDTKKINVSPTLFLALGGSGKETIMRLRRNFYTNMRTTGLPIHEYLWIDTDPRRQNIRGKEYDDIFSKIHMPAADIIDAQVATDQIDNYFNHQSNYDHIFRWLHPSIQSLGPNMLQLGAGAVRPCGRLAFYHHFPDIKQAIRSKLKTITNKNRVDDTTKMNFNVNINAVNVFLVCSNAGGTGAGMLLDMAFLINWIATKERMNVVTTGFVFLPSVFDPVLGEQEMEVVKSNGYATLMELDYYMSPKTGLRLEDDKNPGLIFNWDGKPHKVNAAPFHTIYFMGETNNSAVSLGKDFYTNIFQMTADSIYLEYCNSDFGDEKRSLRVNHEQFLLNETQYTEFDDSKNIIFSQYYPNRYSSFGLSMIKLDIDRKRNAAAYFMGKSLVDYWSSSTDSREKGARDADEALNMAILQGNQMDLATMQVFLLAEGAETLLDAHGNRIRKGFRLVRERMNYFFNRNLGLGLERADRSLSSLVREIEREQDVHAWRQNVPPWNAEPRRSQEGRIIDDEEMIITLSRADRGWDENVDIGAQALGAGGQDAGKINAHTTELLEEILAHFEAKFIDHLSKPGVQDENRGITQTRIFCEEYRMRVERIIGTAIARPLNSCNFVLAPIQKSSALMTTLRRKKEADKIREPLYRRTAKSYYDHQYTAGLHQHLDGVAQDLEAKVNRVEAELLDWFSAKYHNYTCEKVAHILNQVLQKIDKFIHYLNIYKNGLDKLNAKQKALFDAFNSDHDDLHYHHIYQNTDNNWFKEEVRKTLIPRHPMGKAWLWPEFMSAETDGFLIDLLDDLLDSEEEDYGKKRMRTRGFENLFTILTRHESNEKEWGALLKSIERYSFHSMEAFMADANADDAFQTSNVDQNHELKELCKVADIWVKQSAHNIRSVGVNYIGSPERNSATSDIVRKKVNGFSRSQEFPHEKGNIVFYSEKVAFPLFFLEELNDYHDIYSGMAEELNALYKRHLDYRLINKLRNIKPPQSQAKAQELFSAGLITMEALALGCLQWNDGDDRNPGYFSLREHQFEGNRKISLGGNLENMIEVLQASLMWMKTLQERIRDRQRAINVYNGNGLIQVYNIIEYFKNKVYPTLSRAGRLGVTHFDTNSGLICEHLRKHYLKMIVKNNGYKDYKDLKLGDAINALSLDEISREISFKDADAQAPMRVLK